MSNTTNFIDNCYPDGFSAEGLAEIAQKYQELPTSRLLATAYFKIKSVGYNIANHNYKGIDSDDIESIMLERLDFCLKNYKDSNKFTTYFYTVYKNALRTEYQRGRAKKRKCVVSVNIEDLPNLCHKDTPVFKQRMELVLSNMIIIGCECIEMQLVTLLLEGYKYVEISKILRVSVVTLHRVKTRIRVKLDGAALATIIEDTSY